MEATAPAKIILFGEHAVVYGKPAIAVPVSSLRARASIQPQANGKRGLEVVASNLKYRFLVSDLSVPSVEQPLERTVQLVLDDLKAAPPDVIIQIESAIPVASGLGSGAAVSAALARAVGIALNRPLDNACVNEIVYEVEKLHHGTPSGIDNTAVVYEQPIYFVRNSPIERLSIGAPLLLLIGDTGQAALTRTSVGDVRKLYEVQPSHIQPILDDIGNLVLQARQAIETGAAAELGLLMRRNHTLLQQLTVSSSELNTLVQAALDAGALGAKLSGGGRGGNMIALVTQEDAEEVRKALIVAGAVRVIETTVN